MTSQVKRFSMESTSIKLDKEIHKLAKIYAVKHNMQLSELISYSLLTYMQIERCD